MHQSKSLLIGWQCTSRELLDLSDVSWCRSFQLQGRLFVERKEDCSPFDIVTVYRVIASFTDAEKFRFIESVWSQIYFMSSPRRKKPVESSESFDRNGS